MGWFKKKTKEDKKKEVPTLLELPKLPEFPKLENEKVDLTKSKLIHQLPSFPTSSLGEKFSQNTIKDAITGKKEGEEVFDADDFVPTEDEIQMMQRKPFTREATSSDFKTSKSVKRKEPIFIRIDRFEECLQIFEKTKTKILEMESMLKEIKRIKEKEEKELEFWENEIKTIKKQIEKIDKDIFSKIE